jgi:hypothetical protein
MDRYTPGESVLLRNLSAGGELVIELPRSEIPLYVCWDRWREKIGLTPDTILIEPDLERIILTSRVALPMPRKPNRLREVILGPMTAAGERAFLANKNYVRFESGSGEVDTET